MYPQREVTHLSPEYQRKDVVGGFVGGGEELWMVGLELHPEQEEQSEKGMMFSIRGVQRSRKPLSRAWG